MAGGSRLSRGALNVSIAIQHHPARAHLLPALVERLGGNVEIVEDPGADSPIRSPLRTYVAALSRTPDGATHRVVVQDDAWPAERFLQRLLTVLEERPDDLVALFVPGSGVHRRAMLRAVAAGETWARLSPTWVPTVALSWPAGRAREFVSWVAERGYDPWGRDRGDDGIVGKYCAMNRIRAFAPVPSIVEHPDVEPSLIGRRAMGGKNRARVAAIFGGE